MDVTPEILEYIDKSEPDVTVSMPPALWFEIEMALAAAIREWDEFSPPHARRRNNMEHAFRKVGQAMARELYPDESGPHGK